MKLSSTEDDLLQEMRQHIQSPTSRLVNKWYKKQLNDLTISTSTQKAYTFDVLIPYQEMFSKIIFKGLLNQEVCPLNLVKPHGGLFGFSKDFRDQSTPENMRGQINIIELNHDGKSQAHLLLEYLGILLHEMVHSFHFIYSCGCKVCELKNDIFRSGGENHHKFFYTLTGLVEQFVETTLGLTDISLHRYKTLV
jgi:hypothetical protein